VTPQHEGDHAAPGPDSGTHINLPPPAAVRSLAWGPDQKPAERSLAGQVPAEGDHSYYQIMARSLIRAQLGLSLVCLTFALAITASFPILCAVLPPLDRAQVLGMPLTLIALGVSIFPVILIIATFYNYQANRLERQFISLVDHMDGSHADE
jgi:hypothetical protein